MKKTNIFQRIHDNSRIGRYVLYTLLFAVFAPFYFSGLLLFYTSRPILALAHLLMGNFGTAKEVITEWTVWKSLSDL